MKKYSGYDYLCIDIANAYGLDKELFENRILWVKININDLEALTADVKLKDQPLYRKAVMALRKTQAGIPTGHMMGLDACNSGMQIMSALTGCVIGAANTGMVNPNERSDAYGKLTQIMSGLIGATSTVTREEAKQALMTHYYGSKAEPKALFGEDTPDLAAFYNATNQLAPGATELLQDLLDSWQPYALVHEWKLPDGFHARVKVMEKVDARIEVDELDHASFSYEFFENKGSKKGLSNVANVIHSVDAYVLRSIHRRCNYDANLVNFVWACITDELVKRTFGSGVEPLTADTKLAYYVEQYDRSTMADIVIMPYINAGNVNQLDTNHLIALQSILNSMLAHKPFPLVTVHDEFKCHPNNCNAVRQHYINIFAELADSELLTDLMNQLHGTTGGSYTKLSNNLGALIRNSEYALC